MIYFVEATASKMIKIGRTSESIEARLSTLQTGNHEELRLLATCEETESVTEANLHEKFQSSRRGGEWFVPSKDIRDFIFCLNPNAFRGQKNTVRLTFTIPLPNGSPMMTQDLFRRWFGELPETTRIREHWL